MMRKHHRAKKDWDNFIPRVYEDEQESEIESALQSGITSVIYYILHDPQR